MMQNIPARAINKAKWLFKNLRKAVARRVMPGEFYFSHKGVCPCCRQNVTFEAFDSWLRGSFDCPVCNSKPRERALMVVLEKHYPNWRELSIHESSPCDRGASLTLKKEGKNYISSQYYHKQPFGTMIDGHHNEDLENQTFADGIFDIVVTQDVMEHIYEPDKAFAEIARTLKNGGAHIFTVPIINRHYKTERWATKGPDGEPVFLKTPEYHGNPIDAKGSPVTMHWGFDIVDFIKAHTGMETEVEYIDNLDFGIRAEFIEVLVSKKGVLSPKS